MTEHYVTLFDSVFLPQGLALHHSLLEHGGNFNLWILCLDDLCLEVLRNLNIPKIQLLDLALLETPELLNVKSSRTKAEYCWTLTPWAIQWVLQEDQNIFRVTYLDADTFFLKSPTPVFSQLEHSGCSVLITEHGYAPEHDRTITCGKYCVQFMTFFRGAGEEVLFWWRDRCLEWCFARFEHNLFGDQKYLEQFADKFPGLIFSEEADSRFQAPWNCSIFDPNEAVLFHFHSLRICSSSIIKVANAEYLLPDSTREKCYLPYCRLLFNILTDLPMEVAPQFLLPGRRILWGLQYKYMYNRFLRGLPDKLQWVEIGPNKDNFIVYSV